MVTTNTKQTLITSVLALTIVAAAALAAGVGGVAARSTAASPHDNGVGANYTVVLPNEEDHYPGEQGGKASIQHLSTGKEVFENNGAKGLKTLEYIVISSPSIDFSSCTTENTRAFGVDRENDDGGTTTDESLLKHRENSKFMENKIVVDFFDGESIAGESTYLNKSDQIVAVQADCYVMPQEPGWYQINARINGTAYNGKHIDEQGITSHYFYICDCSNEQEAREKLGPPPSEESSGDSGSSSTATATATPTPTPTAADDGGDAESTATATPADSGSEESETATATSAEDGSKDGDATPTASPAQDSGNGTETTSTTTSNTDSSVSDESESPTSNSNSGSDGTGGGNATPTTANGPGFSFLAALVGLLVTAMIGVRRSP